MDEYVQGDLVVLECVFRDANSIPADPSGVKIEVLVPGDTSATLYTYGVDAALTKSSTGHYEIEIDTTGKNGIYYFYWYAIPGTGQVAQQGSFLAIRKNTFVP